MVAAVVGLAATGAAGYRAVPQESAGQEGPAAEAEADPRAQPIAFPHDTHAGAGEGQFGIDCQYCHFSAERSVDAGIPPVGSCRGCHQVIPGRNSPQEVQRLLDYANRGEAIPWVRIYKVADHVHFPHMRHVVADVGCEECHGQVQEMAVIEEVAQPLTMGWCVSCHDEQDVRKDCTACHY